MQWVVKKHNDAEGGKKRENGVNSYTENVKRKKNQRKSNIYNYYYLRKDVDIR